MAAHRLRRHSTLGHLAANLILICSVATSTNAATTVFVAANSPDCEGNGVPGTSCFSSLQEGIDNAGPGAAQVFILEGTYNAADISRMGSAIAAGPADLEISAVDDAFVSIQPAVGSRGISNETVPFAGSVVLRSLRVTSPDRDAIHLEGVTGDVTLESMRVVDAGVDGLDIRNEGEVVLLDSNFDRNANDGVEITSGGSITIERCTANDNFGDVFVASTGAQLGHDGFNLEVLAGDVTIVDSEARRNGGEGFEIHPVFDDVNDTYGRIDSITIHGTESTDNGRRSGFLPNLGDSFDGINDDLNDYPNTIMADGFQIESCDERAASPTGPCTVGDLEIRDSVARNNTQDGLELRVYGDVLLENVMVEGNGNLMSGDGVDMNTDEANSVTGRNLLVTGNADDGIDVGAETFVLLEDVVADDNGKGIPDFHGFGPPPVGEDLLSPGPGADQGIELSAGTEATCRRCTARNNGGTGIQFEGGNATLQFGDGLLATGNLKTGVEMFSSDTVRCHDCYANDNDEDGFHAEAPNVEFIGCEASGSVVEDGLDVNLFEDNASLTIQDCRVQGNFEQGIIYNDMDAYSGVQVNVSDVCAAGNRTGVELHDNGTFVLDRIQANDNLRYGLRIAGRDALTALVSNSNLAGNGLAGFFLDDLDITVPAGSNWWGDLTGPFDPADNPTGLGNPLFDGTNGGGFGTIAFDPPAAQPFGDLTTACDPSVQGPPISGRADLSVSKQVDLANAGPGDALTYTIVVTNPGPLAALGTNISDVLPAALESAQWQCSASFGSTCAAQGVGNIDDTVDVLAGGTVSYQVTATVSATFLGTLDNIATATPAQGVTDPDSSNNTATATTVIGTTADLEIVKLVDSSVAVPGQEIQYTLMVSNLGPGIALGTTVVDDFDDVLEDVSWTCVAATGSSCTAAGVGDLEDTATISSGSNLVYTVVATVASDYLGELTNVATVAAGPGVIDPDPSNNAAGVTTNIQTIISVPTVDPAGLALMVLLLGGAAWWRLKR